MILAVIDDVDNDLKPLMDALLLIEEEMRVESMSLTESFDRLAIFQKIQPDIRPDIVFISFANNPEAYEVALAIKSDEKYTDTVIICYNNTSETDIARTLRETGCLDYIKDFNDKTEIFARLRTAIELRQEIASRRIREQEIEENNKKMQDITNLDSLTGVLSKKYFESKMEEELFRAIRTHSLLSILFIDIVDFRSYYNKFGSLEGDKTLRRISSCLKKSARRPGDLLARINESSFALFLPATEFKGAEFIAKTVTRQIQNLAIEHETGSYKFLTARVNGISFVPKNENDVKEVIAMIAGAPNENNPAHENMNHFCIT